MNLARAKAGGPGGTPHRLAPALISTYTSSWQPTAVAACDKSRTFCASSTQTPICARRASAASRASLGLPTMWLVMRISLTPAAANASASLTFWQHTPTAPKAICRSATAGVLCILACGRNRICRLRAKSAIRTRLRSSTSRSAISAGVSTSSTRVPMAAGAGHCAGGEFVKVRAVKREYQR